MKLGNLKYYGYATGVVLGMIIQLPFFVSFDMEITSAWWAAQISILIFFSILGYITQLKANKKKISLPKLSISKTPKKTHSIEGEKLTEWEKYFILKSIKKDNYVICPNCEGAHMLSGPSGGMSVNIRCPKCGQGINFTLLHRNDTSGLDWCDNIGIDEKWKRTNYEKLIPEPEEKEIETPVVKKKIKVDWKSFQYLPKKIWDLFIKWLNT